MVGVESRLRSFIDVLNRNDPFKTTSEDPDEYASEALSIMSRFSEAFIEDCDPVRRSELATSIVKKTLKYWCGHDSEIDTKVIIDEMLVCYMSVWQTSTSSMLSVVNPFGWYAA